MLKKIMGCLLLAFTLITPVSAWEMAFENHTSDLAVTHISGTPSASLVAVNHGYAYSHGSASSTPSFNISQPWTGYLAYSARSSAGYPVPGVKIYNSAGTLCANGNFNIAGSLVSNGVFKRVELVSFGSVIECYINGEYCGSTSLTSDPSGTGRIVLTFSGATSAITIDDISSEPTIVACDSSVSSSDSFQYYRLGYPNAAECYWFTRLYSPSGVYLSSQNISALGTSGYVEYSYSKSLMTENGTYVIRLYQHDNLSGNNYYYSSRTFNYGSATVSYDGTIELDDNDYLPGDIINIWTHLDSYSSGYSVLTRITTSSGYRTLQYPITSEDQHGSITIPSDALQSGKNFIYILDPSGDVAGYAMYNIYLTAGGPQISFDKSVYDPADKVLISYKNAPTGSDVHLVFRSSDATVDEIDYDASGTTGTIEVDLSEFVSADGLSVFLLDYSGVERAQDLAKIVSGNFYLNGRVYDATTGAAVSGAEVNVGGNTSNSDAQGNYGLMALAGRNAFTVNKAGYMQLSGEVPVYNLITQHNFYITPINNAEGVGVYGTVRSYITDELLSGCTVVVRNNDNGASYSTITDSRGYYSINNENLAGNCTITVSRSNYDPVTQNLNLDAMTFISFRLVAVNGYEEIDLPDTSGGSDDEMISEEEQEYIEKYGEMGQHPFDFNSDGSVSGDEWRYAVERLAILLGLLAFMGFVGLVSRGGRR